MIVVQVNGTLVAGRYRLAQKLGAGGMGTVWRARDESRGIDVALKFLHDHLGGRDQILARFAREAELGARLFSRNTVRVLDRSISEEGSPFIVYELLDGEDLATQLNRLGRLAPATAGEVVIQVCRALERAHAVGVVHRDIKPANIFMCTEDNRLLVKVLDFGIAKVRTKAQSNERESLPPGSLTGTLEHMSPEHVLDGAPTDIRGDLYAVVVVCNRCLTGRVPFIAEALGQLVVSFSRGPAPAPSTLVSDVPPAVDEFFARAIHRVPSERFQSASEMAKSAIVAFRSSARALPVAPIVDATDRSPPSTPTFAQPALPSILDPRRDE